MSEQSGLPADIPLIESMDGDESFTRQAFTIRELPAHLRLAALKKAAEVFGIRAIRLNAPIYESAGITVEEAERDGRGFLKYVAADLPLDYFWYR